MHKLCPSAFGHFRYRPARHAGLVVSAALLLGAAAMPVPAFCAAQTAAGPAAVTVNNPLANRAAVRAPAPATPLATVAASRASSSSSAAAAPAAALAKGGNPGELAAGKRVFAHCAECHALGPSARGAFGPQLNGIVGRPAASTTDFKYSTAMSNAHLVWTEARLRAFIRSPDKVVPGTKMRFWGLGNEQDIDNLLAYLRGFPALTPAAR